MGEGAHRGQIRCSLSAKIACEILPIVLCNLQIPINVSILVFLTCAFVFVNFALLFCVGHLFVLLRNIYN